ncbi:XRE family transcriptional regulator [Acetobacteraceae bacterium EV16G]|uniref:XRE family transcriptional regulator n=1 Tax=Sorlinia euscelidii TaxID=3081148 RepID=A0ABU7U4G5_9PROT
MSNASKKMSRYDSADYLESDEDIAAYLDAAIEERDDEGTLLLSALATIARARGLSA